MTTTPIDLFAVSDALTALAADQGVTFDDEQLDDLTHTVSSALDRARNSAGCSVTNDTRLAATPIYPETHTFPYLHVIEDEEVDPGTLTAYGLRLLDHRYSTMNCQFCEKPGADARVECGVTGAPVEGEPVHVACVIDGGGVVTRTDNVNLVEEEG